MPYLVSFILSYKDKHCESEMIGSTGQGEAQLTEYGDWAWMRLDLPQVWCGFDRASVVSSWHFISTHYHRL
jgi:hypothetical protein